MPRMDVLMQSGKIIQWFKKEGENVKKGEPVVLIEAEKTTFEIEAQESGVIRAILIEQGSEALVGQTLALLGSSDEKIPDRYVRTVMPVQTLADRKLFAQEQPSVWQQTRASPAARSLARQHNIDLAKLKGTGPGGRIQVGDAQKAVDLELRTGTPARIKERIPLTGIRKTVAERLSYSFHTVVPVILTTDVDFEALEEVRRKMGTNISITSFVVKCVASSLRQHLILNSSLEGNQIIVYDDINIAVAINTPNGLTAPAVFQAEKKNLLEITKDIADLREKAYSGKLTFQELTGGTFTVTNLGGEGIEIFVPIINPPQSAILAVGRATKKPVAIGDSVQIRSRVNLSLIFDHRVTDGVPAAQFLTHVKQLLENPSSFLTATEGG